jgi:proline racemase/4-hydroxyproline epimerase
MHVIDSHTGGMPTRVILEGGPELGGGPLRIRANRLAKEHRQFIGSLLSEPRGQPGMVAALLVPPTDPRCVTGVIYFDADAVLDMCGHGTIGLAVTLARMGRIDIGIHKIETPAGIVTIELKDANTVSVTNIESVRIASRVTIDVPNLGQVVGDFAYGGNWFFITELGDTEIAAKTLDRLTERAVAIRDACHRQGLKGPEGQPVDHVILSGTSPHPDVFRRNFVLCPDDEYDRSPCGTGSSAFVACLAADDALAPKEEIILESVIGSRYRVSYRPGPSGGVIPILTGSAHIMAESRLIFAETDPFKHGIDHT